MAVKSINLQSALGKIAVLIVGVMGLIFILLGTIILLGNSISTRVPNQEVAEFAVAMVPNDPQSHFALAVMYEKSFLPENFPKSLAEYEKAVALSPNDFRLWLALGKARERSGDMAGAEKALGRAIELAPNYSQAQWSFGNVLLRQGKNLEAFKVIRSAVDRDPKFAGPAATTAWQIFEGDIDKVRQTIGDSPPVQSALATFLARQKRYDEAYTIWKSLSRDRIKLELKKDSENLANTFLAAKKYKRVIEIQKAIAEQGEPVFEVGKVSNGGFEQKVKTDKQKAFEWKIEKGILPQINIASNEKRGGAQSLVINFKVTKRKDFRSVTQTIAVEGGRDYQFETYYRSKLDTNSTVKWEVVNTGDNKVLASTDPVENETAWKRLGVKFSVPEDSEGVLIRLVRGKCASSVCPINGRIWFDDIAIN